MLCLTSRRCSYLVTIHNCRQRGFSLELRRLRRATLSNRELSRARCPHSSGDSQQVGNPTQPNQFSPLFEFFHSCISRIIDSAQISRPHNKPCSFPKQNFLQEGFADLDESGTPLVKYHMLDASSHHREEKKNLDFWRVTWFSAARFCHGNLTWQIGPVESLCCGKAESLIFIGLDEGLGSYMTGSWPERQSADDCHVVVHVMDLVGHHLRPEVPALLHLHISGGEGGGSPRANVMYRHESKRIAPFPWEGGGREIA
ncbi:hypothetical protein HDV62DRAFT_136897 [Trichoderma sp. SZMC 28011]